MRVDKVGHCCDGIVGLGSSPIADKTAGTMERTLRKRRDCRSADGARAVVVDWWTRAILTVARWYCRDTRYGGQISEGERVKRDEVDCGGFINLWRPLCKRLPGLPLPPGSPRPRPAFFLTYLRGRRPHLVSNSAVSGAVRYCFQPALCAIFS